MEYLAQILAFSAAIVAIRGGTWKNENTGLYRITTTGWITLIIAIAALTTSVIITKNNSIEKQKLIQSENIKTKQLKSIEESSKNSSLSSKAMLLTVDSLNKQISSSNDTILSLKNIVETYDILLKRIQAESNRQPQMVMTNYEEIEPNSAFLAPQKISTGSFIKFIGFKSKLELKYNNRTITLNEDDTDYSAGEIPIFGPSGVSYDWMVYNPNNVTVAGKIFVYSTPRSRSSEWSYLEEKIREAKRNIKIE